MRYDLDDLRLFVFVVEEGSITAGARRMRLSLPSASARVRALEHHAGVRLLERGRRGVRPTPAGATLARHAGEVLARTARLESAVAGYARSPAAPLVLVTGSSAMHRLVPPALTSFLLEYADQDVTVLERRTPQTVRLLATGEADLGIVIEDEARDSGLETETLGDDSLVVVGQAGGVLTGRGTVTYAEVAEHPLVGLDAATPLRRWIDKNLGPHAPVARYRTLVTNLDTLIALASAGVGLAVVPRRALPPGPALDVRELHDPWAHRRHLLCWGTRVRQSSRASRTSRTIAALAEHLRRAYT